MLYSEKDFILKYSLVQEYSANMKHMTYNIEVFKAFKSDSKALDKFGDCNGFKNKMLQANVLFSMLFLSDANFLLAESSKKIQILSNLP